MTRDGSVYIVIPQNPTAGYLPAGPLYLPRHELERASEQLATALTTVRRASATHWRSVLAERYRDELDDLARSLTGAQERVAQAGDEYMRLRWVAYQNGHH